MKMFIDGKELTAEEQAEFEAWEDEQVGDSEPLTTETINRIVREIALGNEPAQPDTEQEADFRKRVAAQIEEIVAAGGEVDLRPE